MNYAYFHGDIIPLSEATINIRNLAFQYGLGVFEGIRAYWNEKERQLYVFRMHDHYDRLVRNCKVLYLNLNQDVNKLSNITLELLRKNQCASDTYIRPMAYVDVDGLGPLLIGQKSTISIYTMPIGEYLPLSGIRATVSSWRRIEDNTIPARCKVTGGYVNSALARSEAVLNGYNEAIMLTGKGYVSEGTAENLFLVRNGQLHTPAVCEDLLEGITRDTIIKIAQDELGLTVVQRPIGRTELYLSDELFLCGTGAQITSIIEVDKRAIGDGIIGPITQNLQSIYFDIVRGRMNKYSHWLTPVF